MNLICLLLSLIVLFNSFPSVKETCMSEEKKEIPSRIWEVSSFRFTVFFDDLNAPDILALFQACCDSDAETDTTERSTNKRTVTGVLGEFRFTLTKTPQRVDAVISPNPPASIAPDPLPFIGNIESTSDLIKKTYTKLIQKFDQFNRLAWGGVYHLRRSSLKAAYETLAAFVPALKIDVENSSDLIYRINRPRIITVGDATCGINRLSSWACVLGMAFKVEASAAQVGVQQAVPESIFATRLETDINTFPSLDLSRFSIAEKLALAENLYDFSTEIALKGDQP